MTGSYSMDIFGKLQSIDRRILYVLIAAVITVPLVKRPARHPDIVFPEVQNAFQVLDNVSQDQIVIMSTIWGPGTEAENGPQTEVLMRHLFQQGVPFAVISWDQAGTELTYRIGQRVAQEVSNETVYGPKKYGTDWVHLGFRIPDTGVMRATMRGMSTDFRQTITKDFRNTPIDKIPMFDGVKSAKQIGAAVEITPSSTIEIWISYFSRPTGIPLIYCPTAVMAAEAYPYLDAGQIKGMLNGVIGAAQYETLIGRGDVATDASATAWALSGAHIYILLLIVIGNLGFIMQKRQSARQQGGQQVD